MVTGWGVSPVCVHEGDTQVDWEIGLVTSPWPCPCPSLMNPKVVIGEIVNKQLVNSTSTVNFEF